ncbi:hypothetical protein HpKG75_02500 [Helicobacter pylori]
MVNPLQSLRLPLGHPLVEKLCKLSLKDKPKDKPAFNEEAAINFKKEVSEEEKIKFKQALRVLHAIVNNETSLRYLSDENQKFLSEKEMNFYARSSLKDLKKGVVAIDFGTKSTTASYMDKNGDYRLLSIGGLVDDTSLTKFENPTIMEFRYKENFLNAYNVLDHRPFTEKNDIGVVHEAQTNAAGVKGNGLYRFFSKLKQWAGADEKQNFRDLEEDFSLESFTNCTDFNPIEIYAYYIGRCINNMENGVFLKYFLSYPIKYEKHQAEKIRESFERGLKKSLPRHVFDDEKTAKTFKMELRASEPCAYAISTLKSYGFFKSEKLDKPIYYGVFDFGGGTTDFDFGKWEKSANPKFAYKMTHFSSGGISI